MKGNMKPKNLFILIIFIIILSFIGLIACGPSEFEYAEVTVYGQPYKYEIVEIEGMTCIFVIGYNRAAITCDWSEYDG